jgi:long-chain fatty acid transport protein
MESMMRNRVIWSMPLTLGSWALASAVTLAQTNQEVNSAYQFNFSNPGARSLAMGGSLTGLADDATAALTNPSGLLFLPATEISFEARFFHYANLFTSGGNLGPPTGVGIDTRQGLVLVETDDSTFSPSFVSFTLPRGRWAIAGYRNELANLETAIETEGAFVSSVLRPDLVVTRLNPLTASLELKVMNYGGAGAFKVSDQLFVGGGVALSQLDFSSRNERLCWTCPAPAQTTRMFDRPGDVFGPPLRTAGNVQFIERQESDDISASFNVGVTVLPHPRVGIGVSYRRGPEFSVDIDGSRGPAAPAGEFGSVVDVPSTGTLKVPDVTAVGFVVRPPMGASSNVLRLSAEIRRVTYSDLIKDFVVTTDPQDVSPSDFTVDDGTEFRVGGEYLIAGRTTVALRGGAWFDPDHRIRYVGPSDTFAALVFRPGDDEWHYTGGAGVTYKAMQFDFAFDRSERVTTTAGSVIVRF